MVLPHLGENGEGKGSTSYLRKYSLFDVCGNKLTTDGRYECKAEAALRWVDMLGPMTWGVIQSRLEESKVMRTRDRWAVGVVMGRGRYDGGGYSWRRRWLVFSTDGWHWCSSHPCSIHGPGNQSLRHPSFWIWLHNACSDCDKAWLIHNLIVDKRIDLACIIETWLGDGSERCAWLGFICGISHKPRVGVEV